MLILLSQNEQRSAETHFSFGQFIHEEYVSMDATSLRKLLQRGATVWNKPTWNSLNTPAWSKICYSTFLTNIISQIVSTLTLWTYCGEWIKYKYRAGCKWVVVSVRYNTIESRYGKWLLTCVMVQWYNEYR